MARLDMEDMKFLEDDGTPCEQCKLYEQHGKKCYFYWENKKECSQRMQ